MSSMFCICAGVNRLCFQVMGQTFPVCCALLVCLYFSGQLPCQTNWLSFTSRICFRDAWSLICFLKRQVWVNYQQLLSIFTEHACACRKGEGEKNTVCQGFGTLAEISSDCIAAFISLDPLFESIYNFWGHFHKDTQEAFLHRFTQLDTVAVERLGSFVCIH